MKTPHAILIGLSLIAAAIFFKDTAVKPAHASGGEDIDMACHFGQLDTGQGDRCWIRHGYYMNLFSGGANEPVTIVNWRAGKKVK